MAQNICHTVFHVSGQLSTTLTLLNHTNNSHHRYMAISLSNTVLSNMVWGDGSYRDPANELRVLGTTIGSLSFSAIVHAQLKLTFDLYEKDTPDNRNKSFGLFMSPQILNLIYFVVTHIRLYAEDLPPRGFQTVSNVSSITSMLVPFFIWVASVISLVFPLIYAARTQVPVPRSVSISSMCLHEMFH